MTNDYSDSEAADFYANPRSRSIHGKEPTRRSDQGLTTHVPVRFSPQTFAEIKDLAAMDGVTVSAWIRAACEDEIARRQPPELQTLSDAVEGEFSFREDRGEFAITATG